MDGQPAYREWKTRNQGYCNLPGGGRKYFPGEYNSEESLAAYRKYVEEVGSAGRAPRGQLTIAELGAKYLAHLKARNAGKRLEAMTVWKRSRYAVRHLLYAGFVDTPVAEFGPKSLKRVVEHMEAEGLSLASVNARLLYVKRIFNWGVSEEIVPPSTLVAIQSVKPLKESDTTAAPPVSRDPVAWEDVDATLPFLNETVRAMVLFQWNTGARSGNVCDAKAEEFAPDCKDKRLLIWTPAKHKTKHLKKELRLVIGPRAQKAIKPFLDARESGFIFRQHDPTRKHRVNFTIHRYYRHIQRAIKAAKAKAGAEVADLLERGLAKEAKAVREPKQWHPHQLRHAKGHAVREQFGIEAQQAAVGWASISAAQVYSEPSMDLARKVARKSG